PRRARHRPAVQPIPLHFDVDAALSDSAVTGREKELLTEVRKKLMETTLETCVLCHEKWFDLGVNAAGKCRKCSKNGYFSAENGMDPGSVPPHLPALTQMEEILISPVHALTQVWQIHGGQYAYRGHICNFPRDSAVLHQRVPLLPEECEILIFRRSGTTNGQQVNEDFRVRRAALETWLKYCCNNSEEGGLDGKIE
ncbi:hypothetical protein B0H14DRAFT_2346110, partial [Mycena olivaceomarginata]